MYFSKLTILSTLFVSVLAAPTYDSGVSKRADVLTVKNYADFQVSSGVAGNALQEVDDEFNAAAFRANPADVSDNDIAIMKAARVTAENAETEAGGFNEAIDAAGKDTDAGKALQNGKIKNKVMKLELQVLLADIEIGKNGDADGSVAAKRTQELTKLNKNVALDEKNAGAASTAVDFQGSSDPATSG
ncbi:hypothetical protein HOO65_020309 [Ceratocystis lukuohia]|uniref:Small secreted protein n=2 Tax=Ceratocystis TaxID=5157 RepID=A0A2C5WX11_9PEZI|nr:hypothetical protein CFIMG_005207RA [Ceratocystis fimbriata CBS 114723]